MELREIFPYNNMILPFFSRGFAEPLQVANVTEFEKIIKII